MAAHFPTPATVFVTPEQTWSLPPREVQAGGGKRQYHAG